MRILIICFAFFVTVLGDQTTITPFPDKVTPTTSVPEFCGEYTATLILDIKSIMVEISLHRLCNNTKLIDFTLPEQNVTIFRGYGNRNFFKDPNYGEKFILKLRNQSNPAADPVTIVPGYVNVTTSSSMNYIKAKMILHEMEPTPVPSDKNKYLNATIIPENSHVTKSETVLLVPGWAGKLDSPMEQRMIPDERSSFLEQKVTVVPGWSAESGFHSLNASVAISATESQHVTIFLKSKESSFFGIFDL